MGNAPEILLYHRVAQAWPDNQLLAVSPGHFDAHLDAIKRCRTLVPLYELIRGVEGGGNMEGMAAITFDDGYADNLLQALPLLEKHQIHATFFCSAVFLQGQKACWDALEAVFLQGRPLPALLNIPFFADRTWPLCSAQQRLRAHDEMLCLLQGLEAPAVAPALAQLFEWAGMKADPALAPRMLRKEELRQLARSPFAEVGSHCISHSRLSALDATAQRREIFESCSALARVVGKPIRLLSYPFGDKHDYNDITRTLVREAGLYGIANYPAKFSSAHLPADVPRYLIRDWSGEEMRVWLDAGEEGRRQMEQGALGERKRRVAPGETRWSPAARTGSTPRRILYVNTKTQGGGAAAVMNSLRQSMAARGHSVDMLTGSGREPGPLHTFCSWRGRPDYAFQRSHLLYRHPAFRQADLLHLHNVHGGYFNPWSISGLSCLKPTVWTLHDMQALTGHCAHAFACEKWRQPGPGCGECPDLAVYPSLRRDTTARLWRDKQTIYAHARLWLITPSLWLQRKVEQSLLNEQAIFCIPNGVDTTVFRPGDKRVWRRKLGIPEDALVLGCCAADGIANAWKGGAHALAVVRELNRFYPSLYFLNIGAGGGERDTPGSVRMISIPYVQAARDLADLYAALDLFLYPTLADSLSLVCIEALCCGVPVTAFATGGVPEAVRDGQDGLLVPTGDTAALLQAARTLLNDGERRRAMGHAASRSARERFSLDLFSRRHEAVYETALAAPLQPEAGRFSMRSVPWLIKGPAFAALERQKYKRAPGGWKRKIRNAGNMFLIAPGGALAQCLGFCAGLLPWSLGKASAAAHAKYGRLKVRSGYAGRDKRTALASILRWLLWQPFWWAELRLAALRTQPRSRVFGLESGTPVDRYYIEAFLRQHKEDIRGHTLEIGNAFYAPQFPERIAKVTVLSAAGGPRVDMVGDLASGENVPAGAFDCLILTQTFQMIFDIKSALRHAYAALAPGGVMLLTCSGISQISRYDMDRWGEYWRMTDRCLEKLLQECCSGAEILVQTYGNVTTAKAFLDGIALQRLPHSVLDAHDPDYQITVAARVAKPAAQRR